VGLTFNQGHNPPADGPSLAKTFIASSIVVLLGTALLFFSTNGGQGFTTETIRRSEVLQHPQRISSFRLLTSDGEETALETLLQTGNKVWIVDFVYTRCQTVCQALGSAYQQLQADILRRGLQDKVGLLSISFDIENDDQRTLSNYAKRMAMHKNVWQVVALKDPKDRQRLLDTFGIIVIPAPLGEYEHNAAMHVVTSNALLVKILGYEDLSNAIDQATDRAVIVAAQPRLPK
jgi:protein SCO1